MSRAIRSEEERFCSEQQERQGEKDRRQHPAAKQEGLPIVPTLGQEGFEWHPALRAISRTVGENLRVHRAGVGGILVGGGGD